MINYKNILDNYERREVTSRGWRMDSEDSMNKLFSAANNKSLSLYAYFPEFYKIVQKMIAYKNEMEKIK
jgi:hypothetical protein